VRIYYIDESHGNLSVVSALGVPARTWNDAFARIKDIRQTLRQNDGIRLAKEFHATDFLAGRGNLGNRIVPKGRRAIIFRELLRLLGNMHDLQVECINAYHINHDHALDRIVNRIQRSLASRDEYGILVFDEGKELETKRALRRMRVFNPVPSMFGMWPEGTSRNIPITRIIADLFFRKSQDDYFLQAVDFIAFSCLRREEPTDRILRYGLQYAFVELDQILNKDAHRADPMGIVRS